MPAASGSKVVTEIKGNKCELSFHLHGIYEGFASISKLMNQFCEKILHLEGNTRAVLKNLRTMLFL